MKMIKLVQLKRRVAFASHMNDTCGIGITFICLHHRLFKKRGTYGLGTYPYPDFGRTVGEDFTKAIIPFARVKAGPMSN